MDRLAAVVPALNEEESISDVVTGLLRSGACCVFVVDGGSVDATAQLASAAGAVVITESRRGYGRACLTGAQAAQAYHPHDLVAYVDGDGSCDPGELRLLAAHTRHANVVLGVRHSRVVQRGSYPWHARLGNSVAARVITSRTGRLVHDLSPFKVLRAEALARLQLRQEGYAWTTELVARACMDPGLTTIETPISFRARRGGTSKVSGRFLPSIKAGLQILRAAIAETSPRPRLVLMAKSPVRAKSRLAATVGREVASGFWTASVTDTAAHLMQAAVRDGLEARVMLSAGDEVGGMKQLLGEAWISDVQERPGLSEALIAVFTCSFVARAQFAIAVSGDNPTLPPSLIHDAVNALRRSDAVLGPTTDGGYYLVGCNRSAFRSRRLDSSLHHIFDRHVSGESAREATHQAMVEAGLSVAVLEPWEDVDNIGDLRQLAITLVRTPEAAPATASWLMTAATQLLPPEPVGEAPRFHVIRFASGGTDVQL